MTYPADESRALREVQNIEDMLEAGGHLPRDVRLSIQWTSWKLLRQFPSNGAYMSLTELPLVFTNTSAFFRCTHVIGNGKISAMEAHCHGQIF